MDHFLEEVVTKKNRLLDEIVYYLALALMVFSGFLGLMYIYSAIGAVTRGGYSFVQILPTLLVGLVSAGMAVLIFLYRDRLRTEYEYTFTNGDLDFAQVFNNSKRKSLGTLKVRTVDAFGPVNSQSFQRYITMPGVKQTRWFLNREAELYYFYFQKDGNKRVIVLEPSEEMVGMIKQYLSHGAYQA